MNPFILILFLMLNFSCLVSAKLNIKGSDTLGAKMVPQLVETYRKLHPTVEFEVEAKGSSWCFNALLDGSADIGISSRQVLEKETKKFEALGFVLKEHIVAYDFIVVIVHEKNEVRDLSLKEVEQIFTGEIKTWDKFGGHGKIMPITRNVSSGTYKSFQKLAMNGKGYGENAQKLAGGESLPTEVGRNVNAIGYCGLAYASKEGIRALSIDGVKPTVRAVRNSPLARGLYFYTVDEVKPEVKKFIEWVKTSEEAHGVIRKVGFIPLQPGVEGEQDDVDELAK